MNTEKLSAKDFIELYLQDRPFSADPAMIQAAEAYAAQEVEELKAERTKLRDWVKQLYLGNFGHQIVEIEQYLTNLPD